MHAHFTAHVYHRHSHESYSFGVTETGAQAFTCRHGRHVSGPGMVMAFNPDDPHDGHAAGDAGFTYRMVHIWPEFFASLIGAGRAAAAVRLAGARRSGDRPVAAPAAHRAHRARHRAGAVRAAHRHGRAAGPARLRARPAGGSRGAGGIRRGCRRADPRAHPRRGYAADLTADDLAAAAGCSRYAAYRAFRQAYGLAPSDYQRQLRVRAARRLLARGVPPAVAAAQAGFADQAHLTRWFRRYYGVTPGAYRGAMCPQAGGS